MCSLVEPLDTAREDLAACLGLFLVAARCLADSCAWVLAFVVAVATDKFVARPWVPGAVVKVREV